MAGSMQRGDTPDLAISQVSPAISFVKGNFKGLFGIFLKVILATIVAEFLAAIIIAGVGLGLLAAMGAPLTGAGELLRYIFANNLAMGVLAIWLILSYLLMAWISKIMSFIKIVKIHGQFEGKYSGMLDIAKWVKLPALKMVLINAAIVFVFVILPGILIYYLLKGIIVALLALIAIFAVYLVLFGIIYLFLLQFWAWELVIGGKGVMESLKSSIALVRKNIVGTAVYDVILVLGGILVAIPFIIVSFGLQIIYTVVNLVSLFAAPDLALAILAIYILLRIIIGLMQAICNDCILLPYTYSFWKNINEEGKTAETRIDKKK